MRQLLYLTTAIILLLSSCKTKPSSTKPTPSGKAGVMVIVMNDSIKKTEGGKLLWDIMVQPMVGLPQEEPMFDASVIPYRSFSDFMKTYRNIVVVDVDPNTKNEGIEFFRGTWAKEQALVKIHAKSSDHLQKMIAENEIKLVGFFVSAERGRLTNYYKKTFNKELSDLVKNQYGFTLQLPREFSLRKQNNNVIWMSHETATSSVGVIIYEADYVGEGSFSKEYLLNTRYQKLKEQVPGPNEGSYMTTEPAFPVTYKQVKMTGDSTAVELRGLWKVEGDMMGGPFISYSHYNPVTNKLLVTEGYVYNPNKPQKRNMMRQLEAILRSYTPAQATEEK